MNCHTMGGAPVGNEATNNLNYHENKAYHQSSCERAVHLRHSSVRQTGHLLQGVKPNKADTNLLVGLFAGRSLSEEAELAGVLLLTINASRAPCKFADPRLAGMYDKPATLNQAHNTDTQPSYAEP